MGCETVQLANGARAIVCSPGRAKRCACGKRADRLCDWKVETRRSGTCDTPVCRVCSHMPAPGKDLCPAHREAWLSRTPAPELTP